MFFYLKGTVTEKKDNFFVLDVSGIGFKVYSSFASLSCISVKQEAKVYTYTYVREDALDIFGFISLDELNFFEKLIGISGVGPRLALAILSTFSVKDIVVAILTNDSKKISKAPGVGPKLAQRMILELKDKVGDEEIESSITCPVNHTPTHSEAIAALLSLGYGETEANRAVSAVGDGFPLEDTIKKALLFLSK